MQFNQYNSTKSMFSHFHTIPQPHQVIEHSIQLVQYHQINSMPFPYHSPATPGDRTLSSISAIPPNKSTPSPHHPSPMPGDRTLSSPSAMPPNQIHTR